MIGVSGLCLDNGLVNLESYSTIVVKSMQHFRGAFASMARAIIVADSGALSSPTTLPSFPFTKVRRPVYPIDQDFEWE